MVNKEDVKIGGTYWLEGDDLPYKVCVVGELLGGGFIADDENSTRLTTLADDMWETEDELIHAMIDRLEDEESIAWEEYNNIKSKIAMLEKRFAEI